MPKTLNFTENEVDVLLQSLLDNNPNFNNVRIFYETCEMFVKEKNYKLEENKNGFFKKFKYLHNPTFLLNENDDILYITMCGKPFICITLNFSVLHEPNFIKNQHMMKMNFLNNLYTLIQNGTIHLPTITTDVH
jgi:hypothetical protein